MIFGMILFVTSIRESSVFAHVRSKRAVLRMGATPKRWYFRMISNLSREDGWRAAPVVEDPVAQMGQHTMGH